MWVKVERKRWNLLGMRNAKDKQDISLHNIRYFNNESHDKPGIWLHKFTNKFLKWIVTLILKMLNVTLYLLIPPYIESPFIECLRTVLTCSKTNFYSIINTAITVSWLQKRAKMFSKGIPAVFIGPPQKVKQKTRKSLFDQK